MYLENKMSIEMGSNQTVKIKERYTYPGLFIGRVGGFLGILLSFALIGGGIYTLDKGGWFVILMGILLTWFMFYVEQSAFERNRPLVVDETGISAIAYGKVWKSIAWPDVTRIERIRTTIYTQLSHRYGYEFVIVGENDQIKLDDTICKMPGYKKYPAILNTLNFYVQRYQIPLVAYDKGEDTKANIKSTVMDKQERKKLLKSGIQSSISSL